MTARARVRDAAIARFGRDGLSAPLRAVAQDAGVSAALIIHLFGSKEELHRACDEHVFAMIRATKTDVLAAADASAMFLTQLAALPEYAPLVAYVLRSLQAGGPGTREFLEQMTEDAVGYIGAGVADGLVVPSRDERARARFLAGANLGQMVLALMVRPPAEDVDWVTYFTGLVEEIALPALEVYTEGFLADRRMLDTYLQYRSDGPRSDAPGPV